MRFIAAIISFVLAFGLIAYGIAQRTVLAKADSITASETLRTDATVTIIDSSTLRALPGRQNIQISGAKKIFEASGRTADVLAWVGDASYNKIGFNREKSTLTNTLVTGKMTKVPDPTNSDLWLDQNSGRGNTLDLTMNVPDGISLIIVSDGKNPAPSGISIRWPLDNRTPWSGPLIVGGIVLLLIGIALYLWGLAQIRRARGPRRKTPKMPKVPRQRQRSYRPRKPRAVAPVAGRRARRRRMIAVVPVLLIGALGLSGCTADSWPNFVSGASSSTPSATPAATAAPGADAQPPVVTVPQLKLIVSRISAVAAKADAAKNVDLIKTRFNGPALDLRLANYAIRKVDDTQPALAAIPAGNAIIVLPQQSKGWPRTVFTVLQNPTDKTIAPVGLMLEQATPRDPYKVEYATAFAAGVALPKLAAANLGAPRLRPDVKLLELEPSKLALAYGDIIEKGPASESNKYFNTKNDKLIGLIGVDARKALQAALPATAKMAFANSDGPYDSIALGSNNSGAVVAAYLNETVTVTPVQAGAAVNPEGAVKSLSGITGTTKGTVAVYGDQLLFYVPSSTSNQKITLLGFATGLISAEEIK